MSCCGDSHGEQIPIGSYAKCPQCNFALSGECLKCFMCGWIAKADPTKTKEESELKTEQDKTQVKGMGSKKEKIKKEKKPTHEDHHGHSHASAVENGMEQLSPKRPKKPSILRKLIAFIMVVTWLVIVLGRVDILKFRGKSISALDPVLESGLRLARPRGYTKQAEAVLQLLGSPATIPESFQASKPHMKDLGKLWVSMRTEIESASRKWVKDNKLKNAIPSGDQALPLTSAVVFLSIFATISFPKHGSLLFATAFIALYSVLNAYDQHMKVLDAGWIAFAAAAAASVLTPDV